MNDFFDSYGSERDENEAEHENTQPFLDDYPVVQDEAISVDVKKEEEKTKSPSPDAKDDIGSDQQQDIEILQGDLNELIGLDNVKLAPLKKPI